MHKKSLEAAHKLTEDDDQQSTGNSRDRNEIRSESIATLRAKAQEHSAKVMEALSSSGGSIKAEDSSHLLSPDTSNDDIDLTTLSQSN